MSVLFLALPIALLLAGIALWAFARAMRAGQFDDLETPALRILFDDLDPPAPSPQGDDLAKLHNSPP